jgi:hypothetical protein
VGSAGPGLQLTGKLLAGLPNLRHLVLHILKGDYGVSPESDGGVYVQEHLAPLKRATQLQELYMATRGCSNACCKGMAGLLPTSLQRLAWRDLVNPIPDLSHLTRLTCLQLRAWRESSLSSSKLPPGLQQLHLTSMQLPEQVLQEQRGVLAGFQSSFYIWNGYEHITTLTELKSAAVAAELIHRPGVLVRFEQLTGLSSLHIDINRYSKDADNSAVVAAAAGFRNLRCLHLNLRHRPPAMGLAALTGLTRLCVTLIRSKHQQQQEQPGPQQQQQRGWADDLACLSSLKWLSTPGDLLLVERPWLGALQQLRVLVLSNFQDSPAGSEGSPGTSLLDQVAQRLQSYSPRDLPPRLLLLGLAGATQQHVASHQLWRHVGCEVVAWPEMKVMGDATQNIDLQFVLKGMPVEVQQALLSG